MPGVNDILNYRSKYDTNGVLVNKLGLTNEEELNKAERMITSFKLTKLCLEPGEQTFDIEHYLRIHKFLFDEIYPFAGEIRSEVISKRLPFCLPQYIQGELKSALDSMREQMPTIQSRDELLKFVTVLYSNLDMIHPFREGNGRTEREFVRQVVDHVCLTNGIGPFTLDYTAIDDRDAYINALVKADAYLDYSDLMVIFDRILVVQEKGQKLEVQK